MAVAVVVLEAEEVGAEGEASRDIGFARNEKAGRAILVRPTLVRTSRPV